MNWEVPWVIDGMSRSPPLLATKRTLFVVFSAFAEDLSSPIVSTQDQPLHKSYTTLALDNSQVRCDRYLDNTV